MTRDLSLPIDRLRSSYDVVVVGSDYGGAVCASRLARAGRRVCVLERGKERHPGDFPSDAAGFAREARVSLPGGDVGPATGLYRFQLDDDVHAVVGSGLGGTSLINAGVAVRPDPRVFDDARWPAGLRGDRAELLAGFERAEAMLVPTPYPEDDGRRPTPALGKLQALEAVSRSMGAPFARVPLAIRFTAGESPAGVAQPACSLCGDCLTGCNRGSKSTLMVNYLPDAVDHGAEIFTRIEVRRIERRDGRWSLWYDAKDLGRERFDAPSATLSADIVILAAGALGSTEILLRSREAGLPLSPLWTQHRSSYDPASGFGYDPEGEGTGGGGGGRDDGAAAPVGPAIAGMIDLRDPARPDLGMAIQETSIPAPLADALPALLAAAAGDRPAAGSGVLAKIRSAARLVRGEHGPRAGAMRSTLAYAVTSYDDSGGKLRLESDRLRIVWPGAGQQPAIGRVHERLADATRALGGTYVPNPAWSSLPQKPPMTTHPLGGCAMGDDASSAVVSHKSEVFAGASGTATHDGLYVCDGSVLPGALGVNPLLTISALAERCVALMVRDRGWAASGPRERRPRAAAPPRAPIGFRFTERMTGWLSPSAASPPPLLRPADASELGFVMTLSWDDLDAVIDDPSTLARTSGTVSAPAVSPLPLTVHDGRFQLFVDGGAPGWLRMRHHASLRDAAGHAYFLDGYKDIHDDPGPDLWRDTATLFVTLHEGDDERGEVLGRGVVQVRLGDLLRQITTMEATGAPSFLAGRRAVLRFVRLFLGKTREIYGGLVLPLVT